MLEHPEAWHQKGRIFPMQAQSTRLTVAELPRSAIIANPDQPRKDFDGIEELAASIAANGLLQPVTVRPDGERFIIIAGERRFRAMSLLAWDTIPCIVRGDLDVASAYVLSVMENVARRDMNPLEEAIAYQELLDAGMEAAEIERSLGLPQQGGGYVTWKVSMLRCVDTIQHLVRRRLMTESMACQFSKLSPDGQRTALRLYQENGLSAGAVKTLIESIWSLENQVDMFPETKLDEETVAAGKTFRDNLATLARAATKLEALDGAKLAEALAHDPALVAMLDGTIKVLRRAKLAIEHSEGRKVALKVGAA